MMSREPECYSHPFESVENELMEPLNPKINEQLSDNGDRASKSHGDKSFQTRPPPLPLPNVAILSSIMDLSWLER